MTQENQSYAPPEYQGEVKLALNRNESSTCFDSVEETLGQIEESIVTRYPSFTALQQEVGDWLGVDSSRIVVTNGGDEGIDRVIRTYIKERRKIVTHAPSFEMFDIYTHNAGGSIEKVDWLSGEFPAQALMDRINEDTALVVIVSPNNPTGLTVSLDDLRAVADRCQAAGCKLLVDEAYIEFADEDPTQALSEHGSVLMVRTFSKAWGLAGLRVGYLIASSTQEANELRALAGPFPVSGVSLNLAHQSLTQRRAKMQDNVNRIRTFRNQIADLVQQCGGEPFPSQGNFVFARFDDPNVWTRLAEEGVAVRKFKDPAMAAFLRITVPTKVSSMIQLCNAMQKATDCQFDSASIIGAVEFSSESNDNPTSKTTPRKSQLKRKTRETDISIELDLDGTGQAEISTGIGFLDHMLTALTFHSRMDLKLICQGDLHIDDHHTAEDCALALGNAISEALGFRKGIRRFGYAYAPLDEGLARTVLDLSGRPWPEVHLDLKREMVGTIASENLTHFFQSLAMTLKCSLHVDVLRGQNDHHKAEAAFKSLALALKSAISPSGTDVPSTKGVL